MIPPRGQGALEYLLLIAGGILVTIMVLVIILSSPLTGVIGGSLNSYESSVTLNALGGGNPSPDCNRIGGPSSLNLVTSSGVGGIQLDFSAVSGGPITYTILRGHAPTALATVQACDFGLADGYHGITLVQTDIPSTTYTDGAIFGGSEYYYRVQACDTASPRHCSASGVVMGIFHQSNPDITLGLPEEVFNDWCAPLDVPDTAAHALHNPQNWNEIIFYASDAPVAYVSYGPDLDHLHRDCTTPALVSNVLVAPDLLNNYEWISSAFSDGTTVHAFVHNEFHDTTFGPPCGTAPDPSNRCWYNTLEYASSSDGKVFSPSMSPGFAYPPLRWTPGTGPGQMGTEPYGYFEPSNVVSRDEGGVTAYYMVIRAFTTPGDGSFSGSCVLRTTNLNDPASWRAWDGTGFNLTMFSPYGPGGGLAPCTPVSPTIIHSMNGSLTYNTVSNKYLLVSDDVYAYNGVPTCGVWYSTSTDLIHWSTPVLITEAQFSGTCGGGSNTKYYASLIDPSSTDPNFATGDNSTYLYYQTINPSDVLDRHLMRQSVTFNVPV